MSRNFHEMTPAERGQFIERVEALLPEHTWWASRVATWTTKKAIWSIEFDWTTMRYTVRQGTENKWVRFDDDINWLEQVLTLMEAVE